MDHHDWLAERFEEHCTHLWAVTYRGAWGSGRGRRVLGPGPGRATGTRQRGRGRHVGSGRTAARRVRHHGRGRKIVAVDIVADPTHLRQLDLAILND